MGNIAGVIRKNLKFYVPGVENKFFNIQFIIAKGGAGFGFSD